MKDVRKVALVHLAARLKAGGYSVLDAQFPNPHLEQFGAITVTEERFQSLLSEALARTGNFYSLGPSGAAPDVGATAGAAGLGGADARAKGGVTAPAGGTAAGAGSSAFHGISPTSLVECSSGFCAGCGWDIPTAKSRFAVRPPAA